MPTVTLPLAENHGAVLSLERDDALGKVTAIVMDCRRADHAVRVFLYRADETLIGKPHVFLPGKLYRRDLPELEKPLFLLAPGTSMGKPVMRIVSPLFRLEGV